MSNASEQAFNRHKLFRGPSPDVGKTTQFKPGASGNPGGRPRRDAAAEIAKAIFERNEEEIYKAMLKALKKGNPKAFTALAERGYGKVPQHVSVDGGGGGPLAFDIEIEFVKAKG